MINKKELEKLSNHMFELTIAYQLNPDKIVDETGVTRNTVIRIQSENPFVEYDDFIKVKKYVDKYYVGEKLRKIKNDGN